MSENKELFEFNYEPIRGYPELRWTGKRPFTGTPYYPAQLKESYGDDVDGWRNKIYWGDNLQVMSHLLKDYRGKVNLIYIDPPFDSKADYKKRISLRNQTAANDFTTFEEKQYGDIWTNDEYLQFMYERLILCRELMREDATIYVQCDSHRVHYVTCIMDEVFGNINQFNIISWQRALAHGDTGQGAKHFGRATDYILAYGKSNQYIFNPQYVPYTEDIINRDYKYTDENGERYRLTPVDGPGGAKKGNPYYNFHGITGYYRYSQEKMEELYQKGEILISKTGKSLSRKRLLKDAKGTSVMDIWTDVNRISPTSSERVDYPTQKPECLLERIIKTSSNPGDLVFDCFMGSGTTQAVAMKLGRRFIGADINLGAVQTTTKRLLKISKDLNGQLQTENQFYTGFEVYNVNDYEFFRNELEAKRLICEAMGMEQLTDSNVYDALYEGRKVSILGINRIATASEFAKLLSNVNISEWQERQKENPTKPVEQITFVCMGHDPNLKAQFEDEVSKMGFKVDVEIIDLLRDKKDLRFKRDSDAKVVIKNGKLIIENFYPMNLLQKLSIEKTDVSDWKEVAESVFIDWNYDGVTFSPETTDIPEKNGFVKGEYEIPESAGTIHIKITDLISESWEGTIEAEAE